MEKRADNVYYLEFVVTDPKIVPKQPERFDAYKGEDRFTTVYRYRNQYITKQRNIKAIDIDRITIHYPCAEAFIEDLFEQKEKNCGCRDRDLGYCCGGSGLPAVQRRIF